MRIILLIFIFCFTISCQSIKEGLTLDKKKNTDEFLVEKKRPLTTPPNYKDLPKPDNDKTDNVSNVSENKNDENEFLSKLKTSEKKSKPGNLSIEKIILKEINSK